LRVNIRKLEALVRDVDGVGRSPLSERLEGSRTHLSRNLEDEVQLCGQLALSPARAGRR
jgi:hypothetical protein